MSDPEDSVDFSDSDDDLLGMQSGYSEISISSNSGPVDITSRNTHKSSEIPNNIVSKTTGWMTQRRNNRNSYNYSFRGPPIINPTSKWPRESRELKHYDIKSRAELDPFIPTMEVIDTKVEMKQNRYQRMREVHDVIGFIVNVHDAINFDIDLEISPELHEKYGDVVSNQYTYKDFDNDFLEDPNLNKTTEITPKIGTTYRCRLRGVGMNQLPHNLHTWKSNKMCVEVKQLIDRTDGWITCTLSDIDVYKRLLVDVVIHTCKGQINLRDYLLARMRDDDDPIFYPYSGKRDRTFKH